MNSGTAIYFQDVSKHFGSTKALDGASFRVERGETVALLGPNGAGKSTAVSILLGLREADSGEVSVLGSPPRGAIGSGRVSALLQESGLPPGVKVREIIQLARDLSPHPAPLAEVLGKAGLDEIADRLVEGLSGGQTQRVRYALAIACDPELLFLDEPTVALDVEGRRAFWRDVRVQAAAGRTVLFATHYLDEAESVADRIVVLRAGQVVADATPADIKASAGQRVIRFSSPHANQTALCSLPGVTNVEVHGTDVVIESTDADATVVALVKQQVAFSNIEVASVALEDAFLALTGARV